MIAISTPILPSPNFINSPLALTFCPLLSC